MPVFTDGSVPGLPRVSDGSFLCPTPVSYTRLVW